MKTSVAMCTYNGEKYIEEQLDSIINQTKKVDEIIVCDDGSTDKTIEILSNYSVKYPNLFKIHQNEKNLRSVKNFEKAIQLCKGDIIFLADQDDIWIENKVAVYLAFFSDNIHINAVASNGYCIDEKSVIHEKYAIWDVPQFLKEKDIKFNYYTLLTQVGNFATGASMAFRKKIIPRIIPFPIIKDFHHDEWIALQTAKNNTFEMLPEKYFKYRIHKNQQVGGVFFNKNTAMKNSLINQFDIHNCDIDFKNLKKRIKYLINIYQRGLHLLEYYNFEDLDTKQNLLVTEQAILKNQVTLEKKYPIKAALLKRVDKILNKRQFKPHQF